MRIGCIGAGKMAEALLAGMLEKGLCRTDEVMLSDPDAARLNALAERYALTGLADNRRVMMESEAVILAVKPQDLDAALTGGVGAAAAGRLVISILAGRRLSVLEAAMPGARVVRVMPNLACQVGQGMSVYCAGSAAGPEDLAFARRMLDCCGQALCMDEDQFDTVTALSGSGPAFFAYLAQAMADAASARGMPLERAWSLALQTMRGTATVMQERSLSPDAFMAAVASKGGTTAAGLDVLSASRVREELAAVIEAAATRSAQLSAPAGDPPA